MTSSHPKTRAHAPFSILACLGLACLGITCLIGACAGSPEADRSAEASPTAPNILFLFADDQRPDTVSAWGNDSIATPNLDRLVERGFSFRRAYNLGSVHGAVCMPSRAMLHTGVPYFGMNLSTFDDRPTLGQLLGEAGYRTFGTGKWHNGRATFARSFQEGRSIFFGGMSDHNEVPLTDLAQGEYGPDRTGDAHSSELFADAAVDFLESYRGDEPFFCYVAFTAPHDPRDPPERHLAPYRANSPPLPANFLPQHPLDTGFLRVRDENLAPWPRTREIVSQQLEEYYALIAHLDEQVGRVLDALERSGARHRTLVVYAADHGLAMGSHGLLGKQNLYEHSIGTPLILAGPGIPAGGASEALVYLHDLFPTLIRRAGAVLPDGPSGSDLMPICAGRLDRVRDTLGSSMGTTLRALRDERWKLIRYPAIDRTQLFDLREDPEERVDLSAQAGQQERIEELTAELEAWQRRVGDLLPLTAEELAPAEVDLSGAERAPDRWQPLWIRKKYFPGS